MTIEGQVASGYEHVADAFARLVDDGHETGAGLSVWSDEQEVVALTGGWADVGRTRPWRADTLVTTYSTSKPFAALTALTAVAQGALDLDEPISTFWKEYAAGGKEATTLRHVLTHRAGLPAFPPAAEAIDLLDDEGLRRSLAEATPQTPPGEVTAEHALTLGHLIDGILRAATGRSLGDLYTEDVRPRLDVDAWFGVPGTELERVAELEHALPGGQEQLIADVFTSYERILTRPKGVMDPARLNSPAWHRSVFGAVGLHATASALATFYGQLTREDGPVRQLLGKELHNEYLASQACGWDATVGTTLNWTLGPLRTEAIIGLGGLGGSAAYWSLRHGHGVAYVSRRLHDFGRIAAIAAALDDDIRIEVTCP